MTAPAMDLTAAVAALSTSSDFRLLRRFEPQTRYHDEPWKLGDKSRARLGVYVDCETTGLDTDADEIIELACVPFTYDAETGLVYTVSEPLTYLEEPRRPITAEITEITGITPAMVAGKKIDDADVALLIGAAHLIVAHSARFDRKMTERRLPVFVDKPWACSQEDVPWRRFGVAGGALLNIAMAACGVFTEGAHRAAHDCQLGIHVLATAMLDDRTALSYLLESARQPTHRVIARNTMRGTNTMLKARQYRALYDGPRFCYWYKDLKPSDAITEECDWLADEVGADTDVEQITAKDRYSVRA